MEGFGKIRQKPPRLPNVPSAQANTLVNGSLEHVAASWLAQFRTVRKEFTVQPDQGAAIIGEMVKHWIYAGTEDGRIQTFELRGKSQILKRMGGILWSTD